ncbi:hypothetical protein EPN90_01945 [Patescibacteria group bacterium]|nr:MAG: hypothetical protein EPN90_01945 [Patescibacteria group bacterium]
MKQKTYQAAAKRLRVLKAKPGRKNRIVHRTAGQDHFNARESGKVTRGKRRARGLSSSYLKSVKTMLPGIN